MKPKVFTEANYDKECYLVFEKVQNSVVVRVVDKKGDYLSDALVQFLSAADGIKMRLLLETKSPVEKGDEIYITL